MTGLSTEDRDKLIAAAIEAKEGSYSPYSKFRVGAAFMTPSGAIIKGANIENASYGATICAERTALVKAASEGIREFVALAVTTDVPSAISPCGICRQFIREFCALKLPVYLVPANYGSHGDSKGEITETTLGDLLPYSFGPEDLELPRI
ncbi:cytidine deaminase [Calocera viscosa TUFC12733]|uniref:Cytidine deaminase n=1 Tax=Calocera viscosa (strain TUFC12733) TaxID=1330018 RepID=A0A167IPG2_CALVF|nr:cytidine deaminase [Calocera viscosa TUFC12733]